MKRKSTWFPAVALMAAAWLCGGAQAAAQETEESSEEQTFLTVSDEIRVIFNRTGGHASDVTVTVADNTGKVMDGVTGTIAVSPDTLKNSGSAVTSAIVCPDVNGYEATTQVRTTMTFTVGLTGLPDDFTFNAVDAKLWALNASGMAQAVKAGRTWDIAVLQGNDSTSLDTLDKRSYDLTTAIPYSALFGKNGTGDGQEATSGTDGKTLYFRLVASLTGTNGCYIGLDTLRLYTINTVDEPSGLYRIQNYMRKASTGNIGHNGYGTGGYLEVVDSLEHPAWTAIKLNANDPDDSRATALWQFEKGVLAGQYYLYNLNSGRYVQKANSGYVWTTKEKTNAGLYTVTSDTTGRSFVTAVGGKQLHASGQDVANLAGIMPYNGGRNSASAWYIYPATTIDLTVSEAGWATVNYPFAVQLPKGLKAYTVTGETSDKSAVNLEEMEESPIPANTPVLLQGDAKTYRLTLCTDGEEATEQADEESSESGLMGTTLSEVIADGVTAYVLAMPSASEGEGEGQTEETSGEVGFYLLASNGSGSTSNRTISGNKAYYVSNGSGAAAASLRFAFGEDGTVTGIGSAAGTEAVDGEAAVYYDLQGRRVLYPSRGIYVTADGKKVFIK